MMVNAEITEKGLTLYKKIFVRHLKELGIYNAVKTKYFHRRNLTFNHHILSSTGSEDVIFGAVTTLWTPVNNSLLNGVAKASLFLMCVLTDENFPHVFKERHIQGPICDMIRREISYLMSLDNNHWENFELNDALFLYDFIKNYADGRLWLESYMSKFSLVKGF